MTSLLRVATVLVTSSSASTPLRMVTLKADRLAHSRQYFSTGVLDNARAGSRDKSDQARSTGQLFDASQPVSYRDQA